MSNKIRQSNEVKGIVMFNMEIKLSQFADDTNLFCSDITSEKNALMILESFGEVSGLKLNIEKTKAMWLGKLVNNKEKPLDLKWVKNPTRTLGIYVSYDSQGNDKLNFETKIQKFQTKLEIRYMEIKRPNTFWEGTDQQDLRYILPCVFYVEY